MKMNIGMMIGLGGGVIGGAVGIAAAFGADPFAGVFTALMVTGVFALIYFVLIKPGITYQRLLKTGIRGEGRILSLSETGTRINNQPVVKFQLMVKLPGVPEYMAEARSVISYLQVSQFQPGAVIPVMADPKDNKKVLFIRQEDIGNAMITASPEEIEALKLKLEEMEKANVLIRETGIYCKAIVTSYTMMGVNVNGNNPLVTLEIQVMPDNAPAFGATAKGVIGQEAISKFQPGEEIFVKYDASDKTKVCIMHS